MAGRRPLWSTLVVPLALGLGAAGCGHGAPAMVSRRPAVDPPVLGAAGIATTGAIAGRVAENDDGAPLSLATIVVSSPALGEQTGYTDETGGYLVVELPPGEYDVHAIYGEAETTRARVPVRAGEVTIVNPSIDVASAPLGRRLDQGALRNIPWPGRTSTTIWGDQLRRLRRDP